MKFPARKRTWSTTSVHRSECGGGYLIKLDSSPLKTPEGSAFVVPTWELAAIVAREWDEQDAEIVPDRLPTTRLCNSAIDRVDVIRAEMIDRAIRYGESDLLCYRSDTSSELRDRQSQTWDPILKWAEREFSSALLVTSGVVPVEQPEASIEALRVLLERHDDFRLSAMQELVTLSGSLLLALAVVHRFRTPQAAWLASRIDEDWQAEKWGIDAEASKQAANAKNHFLVAAEMISALDGTVDAVEGVT